MQHIRFSPRCCTVFNHPIDSVVIDVLHTFSNPGDQPTHFLNTFTPPQYIHYFEEMSKLMARFGPPTPEQGRAIVARYNTDILV